MPLLQASVAIPALNEEHYLPDLLRSLCAQREVLLDIVVVEGNSDDRTVEVTRQIMAANTNPNVEIRIYTVTIRNVSVQRNEAVSHARHENLLFFDADTRIPHPYWIRNVLRSFRHRGAEIASCRFRPFETNPVAHLYFAIVYFFHLVMRPINPYAIGAMLLTNRTMFDRVGGFDTKIVVNEDANLVKRIARHGPFVVLCDCCLISARRFLKGGFFKTGLLYLKLFLHRTIHGEIDGDLGYWDDQKYDRPPA